MKQGDIIYRVTKNKYDGRWYFYIYELVRHSYHVGQKQIYLELAPILVHADSKYKQHTTMMISAGKSDCSFWRGKWDFVTTDENLAKNTYKEKIENENQSND